MSEEVVKGVTKSEVLDLKIKGESDYHTAFVMQFRYLAEKHSKKVLEDFIADHFPEDSKVSTTYTGKYEYTIPPTYEYQEIWRRPGSNVRLATKEDVERWRNESTTDNSPKEKHQPSKFKVNATETPHKDSLLIDKIREMYGYRFANGFGSLRTFDNAPEEEVVEKEQQYGRVYSDLETSSKNPIEKCSSAKTDEKCNQSVSRETKYKVGDFVYLLDRKISKLRITRAKNGDYEAVDLYSSFYFKDEDDCNCVFQSIEELVDYVRKSAESL